MNKIDQPLDDIVKESRQKHLVERRKRFRNRRNRRLADGTSNPSENGNAPAESTGMDIETPAKEPKRRGAIRKQRRSKRQASVGGNGTMDVEVVGKKAKMNVEVSTANASKNNNSIAGSKKPNKGAKVMVSNLDPGVTQTDIAELFETVGPLKSAKLLMHADGRSAGSAEVIFEKIGHAVEAIKKYNNVPLDNRPLQITLATDSAPLRITKDRRGQKKMIIDTRGDDTLLSNGGARDMDQDYDRGRLREVEPMIDRMDERDDGRNSNDTRRPRFAGRSRRRNGPRLRGSSYEARGGNNSNGMYLE